MEATLTLAVPDGRLLQPALAYLDRCGLLPPGFAFAERGLVAEPAPGLRLLRVRPLDVGAYVAAGAAEAGIVGRDVLWEQEPDVYDLADLGFGRCRVVLAAPRPADARPPVPAADVAGRPLRVATKYPRLARRLLAARGLGAQVVALAGHVELAPRVGLADAVVDLVDTGRTLAENGLEPVLELAQVGARLIVNPVAFRLRRERLEPLLASAVLAVAAPAHGVGPACG